MAKTARRIRNLDVLIVKLEKLERDVSREEIEAALLLAAQPVVDAARANAPVRSGNLRDSIRSEVVDDEGKPEVRVGTNLFYGRYQEFGTKRLAARPFLRPALDEKRAEAIEIFRRELGAKIRSVARG